MTTDVLSLQRVSMVFRPHYMAPVHALCNVTLNIKQGEFVCVIGANGSGKSTLLRIIAGVYRCTGGSIFLNGCNISESSEQRRARNIALIDQIPGARMAPGLSIEQNLALTMMRTHRRPFWQFAIRQKEREQFKELLVSLGLGLENRLKAKLRELSGGQAQALTVAALTGLVTPQLMLLDEHCAALDPRMAALVMSNTAALCKERMITTIMVTHDFEHAAAYGDRLILMKEGNLAMDVRDDEKKSLGARDIFDLFMQHQASQTR